MHDGGRDHTGTIEAVKLLVPELRSRGVTESQIATMLIENPRRYFAA